MLFQEGLKSILIISLKKNLLSKSKFNKAINDHSSCHGCVTLHFKSYIKQGMDTGSKSRLAGPDHKKATFLEQEGHLEEKRRRKMPLKRSERLSEKLEGRACASVS